MLLDVLRDAAARHPERHALRTADAACSYTALVARAEALACGLHARGIVRFGISATDPLAVVALLAAASAVGAEACAYPRNLEPDGVAELAQRLGHETVIGDHDHTVGTVPLNALPLALDGVALPARPEQTPVLILTTGTSGVPKGVRHDWSRLIAAVHRTDEDGARWLLAYNINQFAGYQVLLHAFVHHATLVIPRTSQARDAAEAMRSSGVTHASATPTFWRLLAGQDTSGLALEQITLGGEAAPASLLGKLRVAFPETKIAHVYAGTEFGSAVAVTDGKAGLPLDVLERGADAGAQFRVRDGELHVRSPHAMLGYHGDEDSAGTWHPTGDLVEERDGRLHFVGRTVEIINVGGAKVHPLPIEELVSSVPGVVLAAVHGQANAVTGQIVAVDIIADPEVDTAKLKAEIRAACASLPAPGRPRRIRFVDKLETRGEKLVRRRAEASA